MPTDDPADGPAEAIGGERPARAVGEHLVFFLGLVPFTIAAMRVYLMAQGDLATMMTLVKTLDVSALVLGTFIRFIGIFGVVSIAYAGYRLYWPQLTGRSDRRVGWSGLSVLVLLFLAAVGCLYPEQLLDTGNHSLGPIDLARAFGWTVVGYLVLRMLRFGVVGPPGHVGKHEKSWRQQVFDRKSLFKAEVLLVAPAVLLLFWQYLITNDRMWLPPQVVVLRTAPADLTAQPPTGIDPVVVRPGGDVAFIGYVVEADLVEATIVRPGGGVVVVRRDTVADLLTCQYEPDFDPGGDAPLLSRLPGFGRVVDNRQNPVCATLLPGA